MSADEPVVSELERVLELIDALDYPPDDLRHGFADIAIEAAAAIDEGWIVDGPHPPRWHLWYVLQDMTDNPNGPPNRLNEIRLRHIARVWAGVRARHFGRPPPDDDSTTERPPWRTPNPRRTGS